MTVTSGYKQTKLGVIPEDWCATALGEHADFKTGPFGSALHKSDYVADGIPIVNPMQIVGGKIIPTSRMSITENAATKLSDFRLYPGDVVIGRRGDMGRCATVQSNQSGWLCGTGSMIVRARPTLNADFAQRVLSSPPAIAAIEDASVGSTMVNLNQATLKNLLIPLPTSDEQEAIAEALSDADALLESLEQLIAKKRQIKQGAMQQLLTGQKRLPGFAGEWDDLPLEQIAEIRSGGTPSTANPGFWNGGVAWCTPTDITALRGRKYLTETERTISHAGLRASSAEVIPPHSTIMTTRATIGECAINTHPITTNQGFKNLIPIAADAEFLYYLMATQKERLIQLCAGSTFLEVGKKQLQKFDVSLPSDPDEQHAIAKVLSDIDAEITELETKRAKTRQIKQGMMQQLLTGQIRLV